MSRKIHQHPVELLTITYLKKLSKSRKLRAEQHTIDKAAKLIGIALESPCCTDTEVLFTTYQENYFIQVLKSLLNGIDTRKWKASLERTKTLLEQTLVTCCRIDVTINFPDTEADMMRVIFMGQENQGTYQTEYKGNGTASVVLTLPKKGKYNITFQTNAVIGSGTLSMDEFTPDQDNFGGPLIRSGAAGTSVRNGVYLDTIYTISEEA